MSQDEDIDFDDAACSLHRRPVFALVGGQLLALEMPGNHQGGGAMPSDLSQDQA